MINKLKSIDFDMHSRARRIWMQIEADTGLMMTPSLTETICYWMQIDIRQSIQTLIHNET
jgi:hypothetical protein